MEGTAGVMGPDVDGACLDFGETSRETPGLVWIKQWREAGELN